jgi:hypothetical protein
MSAGCVACGSLCPPGFRHCLVCHSYNDIYISVRYAEIGLHQHRLRRALDYLHGRRRPAESLASLVAKLTRRVKELEDRYYYE